MRTETPIKASILQNAFEENENRLLVERTKIACCLGIILGVGSGVMDHFVHPEAAMQLWTIRISFGILSLGLWKLCYAPWSLKRAHFLSLSWVYIMLVSHALMLIFTGGVVSTYYPGITIILLVSTLYFPLAFVELLVACIFALILYLVFCLGEVLWQGLPSTANWKQIFVSQSVIFFDFLVVIAASSYFSSRLRFRDFKLQFDLDQKKNELEISYKKLAELDKAKSQFFANISHELRTPLTLIISPLEEIRKKISAEDDPHTSEIVEIMFSNCMRLLSLINDLLDLVRLEDGKLSLHLEPIDLSNLLPGLVSSVKSLADRSKIRVRLEGIKSYSLVVEADKDRMEKIFLNLLFNSIKFTPKGGEIVVSVSKADEKALVKIRDNGIGIASEKLDFIFDRFWQENGDLNRERQGTGIGLSLVRELVELHKGKISVDSKKNHGTTFSIELPITKSEVSSTVKKAESGHWLSNLYRTAQQYQTHAKLQDKTKSSELNLSISKGKLLIVEDEPDMMRFLAHELEIDYSLVKATDGEMGIKLALEHQPQLILTDLMLPKVDGITLCQRLKNSPSMLPTKIILLTARAEDQAKMAALNAGADDFLSKPFSSLELKTRLENLLLNAKLERTLQDQNQTLENTLTQLRNAESHLIQTERLSALGNLSAGIMHEINNPINFMLTAVHCLRSELSDSTVDASETINDIEDGLKRIRDIIVDLKSFAYEGKSGTKTDCDPQSLYRTCLRLLGHQIKKDIKISENIDAQSSVIGNQNQLVQLLVNLIQNSIHATANNSDLGKDRKIDVTMVPDKNEFCITIRDNGSGISKDLQTKIFDPFFTTKDQGEGTGLGLSISHTIVRKHGGKIEVSSTPGEYTQFVIRLPLAESAKIATESVTLT